MVAVAQHGVEGLHQELQTGHRASDTSGAVVPDAGDSGSSQSAVRPGERGARQLVGAWGLLREIELAGITRGDFTGAG